MTVCFAFYFLAFHFSPILHWNNFSKNIFSFLGHLPTTAYLKAQHTSYEHQMINKLKLNRHYLVISKEFVVCWSSNKKGLISLLIRAIFMKNTINITGTG